jgi:NADH-ubiquinone oxidoreductase chain 6
MANLYLIIETFTDGHSITFLDVISVISILCAILVIVTKNPVLSVLFLIGLFLAISSYLILIGFTFIGLSYLLVYVGAVSILFLFILMLINIRVSELLSETKNSIPLVIMVTVYLSIVLESILYFSNIFRQTETQIISTTNWDSSLWSTIHISSIGNILYTNYFMWLILTSIILLLAMVGAIVITLKPKKR